VLTYNKFGKVISASGDKAYNDAKIAEVEHFDEVGKISPNTYTATESWINAWPKYESEFSAMYTKAVVGQIPMSEFEAHVDWINEQPDIKKAYLDMAEAYKNFHEQ
jgi:putative aldouronate transport system substrate-binding protein